MPVTSVFAQVEVAALRGGPLLALRSLLEHGERLLDVGGEDVAPAESVDERQDLRPRVAVVQGRADLEEDGAALGAERVGAVHDLSLIHISEPTRLGMISYAVFCLKKK